MRTLVWSSSPTQLTNQPADPPLANLQTCTMTLVITPATTPWPFDELSTGHPMTSWAVRLSSRRSLKRLAEVCTALEDPSTGLRAGAGAGVEDESCRETAGRVLGGGQGEWRIRNSQLEIPTD